MSQAEKEIVVSGKVCIVAVLPDGSKILADGHNRRNTCVDFDMPFLTVEMVFNSRESVIQWVIDNQFARRNLTEERKAYYRGKEFLNTRKSEGNPQLAQSELVENSEGETAENVGNKHGVSRETVKRDAKFTAAVDAMPKQDAEIVLNGNSGMTKADVVNGKKLILCDRCQPSNSRMTSLTVRPPAALSNSKKASESYHQREVFFA